MPKTILLVEDNPDDEALTLRALKKHVAHRIAVARNGVEALDYLFCTGSHAGCDSSLKPLLVLLDLKLPKVSGLEVLRAMRNNPATRAIPVVVFTSSTEEQDILDSYDLGANSYIRKPVDYQKFCEDVKQVSLYWLSLNLMPPQRPGKG